MASQLPSSFHIPLHLASPLLSDPTASISSSSPTSISCLATLDSRNRNVPTSRLRFTLVPREMGTGSCVGSTKSSFQGAGVMRIKSECHSSLDKPAVLCQSARSTGFALPSCSSRLSSSVSPARASSGTKQKTQSTGDVDYRDDAKVVQVHTIKQFEDALTSAKSKLVVVEYAASHSANSRRIYPSMVELSRTCQDVVFLLVMGDESDETRQLCSQANIEKVPHFTFYKNKELIHEEEGIGPDELLGDVLYYGDTDAPILQLHSRQDVEDLLAKHVSDQKLVVLDVGLKHCGPCVKVYPTFVKLSKKMKDTTVFARINGDENEELMDLLKQMDVVEVPTFLFIRDGKLCGRYVGSGKGELIGEILKYQGVRVTY